MPLSLDTEQTSHVQLPIFPRPPKVDSYNSVLLYRGSSIQEGLGALGKRESCVPLKKVRHLPRL